MTEMFVLRTDTPRDGNGGWHGMMLHIRRTIKTFKRYNQIRQLFLQEPCLVITVQLKGEDKLTDEERTAFERGIEFGED